MATTCIQLVKDLRARVAAATKHSGTTVHQFILAAVAEMTKKAERRACIDAMAEQRYVNIVSDVKTIPWAEMRKYLEARVAGKPAKRPVARKLAR